MDRRIGNRPIRPGWSSPMAHCTRLSLMFGALLDPGDLVIVENPSFPDRTARPAVSQCSLPVGRGRRRRTGRRCAGNTSAAPRCSPEDRVHDSGLSQSDRCHPVGSPANSIGRTRPAVRLRDRRRQSLSGTAIRRRGIPRAGCRVRSGDPGQYLLEDPRTRASAGLGRSADLARAGDQPNPAEPRPARIAADPAGCVRTWSQFPASSTPSPARRPGCTGSDPTVLRNALEEASGGLLQVPAVEGGLFQWGTVQDPTIDVAAAHERARGARHGFPSRGSFRFQCTPACSPTTFGSASALLLSISSPWQHSGSPSRSPTDRPAIRATRHPNRCTIRRNCLSPMTSPTLRSHRMSSRPFRRSAGVLAAAALLAGCASAATTTGAAARAVR